MEQTLNNNFKPLNALTSIDEVYLEITSGNKVLDIINSLRDNGFSSMTYDIEVRDNDNVKVIRTWFKEVENFLSNITVKEISREEYSNKYDDIYASHDTNKIVKKLKEGEGICSICFKEYTHWGNNAWPVNEGRCCDTCNTNIVIPARIQRRINKKEDK